MHGHAVPTISLEELYRGWSEARGVKMDPLISELLERMSYKQLYALSEPKRKERSRHVSGPPLKLGAYQDATYYYFNFKSQPSTTGLRHKGFIKFMKPRMSSAREAENMDCIIDCTCFEGSALVLMGDGTYKPISEIRHGDMVVTHRGRVRPVIGNVERELKPGEKVYRVGITGFPGTVTVTENHPFYTLRGNKTCRCGCGSELPLELLDSVSVTTSRLRRQFLKGHHRQRSQLSNETIASVLAEYRAHGGTTAQLASKFGICKSSASNIIKGKTKPTRQLQDEPEFAWVPVKDFRKSEWFMTPWLEPGTTSLDGDVARFLGYYAAEGCLGTDRDDVRFSLNLDEKETLGADIVSIANRHLGEHFRLPGPYAGKQSSCVRINDCSGDNFARPMHAFQAVCYVTPEFRRFIEENVGCGSWHKRLSNFVMSLDAAASKSFLTGLFLGDGHVNVKSHFRWSSVSDALVFQVSTLLNRLRVRHRITDASHGLAIDVCPGDSTREVFSWLSPYLRGWQLERTCESPEQVDFSRNEGYLRALRHYEEVAYTGTVWDLAVAEDESFVVNGVAVHNCPDFKYRWAWANKQRGSSRVGPGSLNQAWNRAPRVTNPTGRPGLCVAKGEMVSTERGIIPIEEVRVGDRVWTLEGWKRVMAAAQTGVKSVIAVNLKSGRRIRLTPEHEVYAFDDSTGFNWIQAGQLTSKHRLCSIYPDAVNTPFETVSVPPFVNGGSSLTYAGKTVILNETVAELLGYMTSEGARGRFCNLNDALNSDFENKWKAVFGSDSASATSNGVFIGNHGNRILESIGFVFGSYNKTVPEWILRGRRSIVVAFLRGCYAGDGNFCGNQSTYATVSESLGRSLHLLISSLGVVTSLDVYKSGMHKVDAWTIRTTSSEQTKKLYNILNPIRGYSSEPPCGGSHGLHDHIIRNPRKLVETTVLKHLENSVDDRQIRVSEIHEHIPDVGMTWRSVSSKLSKSGRSCTVGRICDLFEVVQNNRAKTIAARLSLRRNKGSYQNRFVLKHELVKLKSSVPGAYDELKTLVREDVTFDQVESVRHQCEEVPVYDLTVEDVSHFTVNGVVVHNCKHLLALADYIFGTLVSFRGTAPEASEFNKQLDRLVRYSTDRWINYDQHVATARERDRRAADVRAARRRGITPPELSRDVPSEADSMLEEPPQENENQDNT